MTLSTVSSVTSTLHVIALIGHLVGIAFGVGGSTVSDLVFVSCVRRRRTDHTLQVVMHVAGRCVMVGLGLLIASGFALVATGTHPSQRFWAKMVVVAVITLNGTIAHRLTFPRLSTALREGRVQLTLPFLHQLSVAAAISATSWYTALVLGAWKTAHLTLGLYLMIYVGALFVAMVFSLLMTPTILDVNGLASVVIVASSSPPAMRVPEAVTLLPAPGPAPRPAPREVMEVLEVMAGHHR